MTETPPLAPRTRRPLCLRACLMALLVGIGLAGCETKSFLNPGELVDPSKENQLRPDGRARPRIQNILTELDVGVTPVPRAYINTRPVQAADLEVNPQDYRLGPGDLVQVSISDLLPGQQAFVRPLRVSDTGLLTLPDLPPEYVQIRVAGLTEVEAAAEIAKVYVDAGVFITPPPVSLLVVEPNSKVYNIFGNMQEPSRYVLVKSDMRLLDALVIAQGIADPDLNNEFAYVIRAVQAPPVTRPAVPDREDPLRPRSSVDRAEWLFNGESADAEGATFASAQGAQPATPREGFSFDPPREPEDIEIIRVPLQELLRGQLKYNVVIRPEDTIIVPPPEIGEYYVYGQVVAPGAFVILPGRRLTIKQAITTARGLGELAIPARTQFVRRIDNQDVFIRVDLSKIFVGTEPDIYLQPYDMIFVGTNAAAPFLAAFRNGFRVTYGFGFIYDRNFAYDNDNPLGF